MDPMLRKFVDYCEQSELEFQKWLRQSIAEEIDCNELIGSDPTAGDTD